MSGELVINAAPYETRVALLENGHVVEFYFERPSDKGITGNIYKGRVIKVLPGMQSAFVDIGLEKAAFLHVGDVILNQEDVVITEFLSVEENILTSVVESENKTCRNISSSLLSSSPIEDRLREGQEVLVQIAKEPLGTKGARVTTNITIPGRKLVLMPLVRHVGVSRRIEDESERERLREIIASIKPPNVGFIVRTAAEGSDRDKLLAEMDFLLKVWESIKEKASKAPVPAIIYRELDVTLRAARDLFAREVEKLIVDSEKEYEKILQFLDAFAPSLKSQVELYGGTQPIFDAYGIEMEIQRALGKKVWLKSGGYIVIESTEALTTIDVNTGRYVGKRNLEETVLKTNLEAVQEIVCQLRLRNIGGIIIIDFIDMEKPSDRERVFQALVDALKRDRSKTKVLPMSEFGLVQMTRKRTRESIERLLHEACPYCDGTGFIKSKQSVCYEILRAIERERSELFGKPIVVRAHPDVIGLFYDEERASFEYVEEDLHTRIYLQPDSSLHHEEFDIIPLSEEMAKQLECGSA
ncbi:MAG: Rne/Rng family ribonuclease [Syntrophobacterales bacterium]|nr:Rne/Rng family ribonuclease [Syntrophobacterales bacterium]